jgi:hypothetical protein
MPVSEERWCSKLLITANHVSAAIVSVAGYTDCLQNVPGTFQRESLSFSVIIHSIWTLLMPTSEYIVSPALHVTKIPEQLSPDSAAPLLCGMFFILASRQYQR